MDIRYFGLLLQIQTVRALQLVGEITFNYPADKNELVNRKFLVFQQDNVRLHLFLVPRSNLNELE